MSTETANTLWPVTESDRGSSALNVRRTLDRPTLAAASVVYGAVLFNAVLALVNANVVPLSSASVIACEALLDAAALLCCFTVVTPLKTPCVALMVLLGVTTLISTVGNMHLDPKFARDVMIIPIYTYLGLVARREDIIRIILPLHAIVLIVTLFEAVWPGEFGRYFNVTSYYIQTRGFEESNFWSKENSDLFVSATRPGERFLFGSLNIHRLSSVFLEPVSLGNYVVIVSMTLAALWNQLRAGQKAFFVLSTFVILVGCDGRFATVSIVAVILMRYAAPVLPRYSNITYLPAILLCSAVAVAVYNLNPLGDDFSSRTAGSIHAILQMDFASLFGFEAAHAYMVMDSGIAYLLYSQSLIGAVAIWIFISCGLLRCDLISRRFSHMTALYWASNLLVSYSVFSIKTAGLLWFIFGSMAQTKSGGEDVKVVARDAPETDG